MSERLQSHEIRPEIQETIQFAENILKGEYGGKPDDGLDPAEVFSGPILDLNDETLTDQEKEFVLGWIEKKLGTQLEEAKVQRTLQSPDELTRVEIFDVPFVEPPPQDETGTEPLTWYISRWQDQDKKPSYTFWPEEMYELGYEEIEK